MSTLALMPLDDRPVNYDHPWWLGRSIGIEVVRPPREWLGSPFRTAARGPLAGWLQDVGSEADAVVVAIDTLAYGGLIPSRQSTTPLEEVVAALEPLRALRRARPGIPILAFSILMRVNRSNSAEEEKSYWLTHGREMFRLSYLEDKQACGDSDAHEDIERETLCASLPPEFVADYQAGRARNHQVNRLALDWAADGIVDYALIAQDDTAPYGWNIAEARDLRRVIERRGLAARASVYPGADEVGSLLVAAVACRQAGFAPRVWPRYSGVDGACAVTAFEDRPFGELIKAHLGPLGGSLAGGPEDADLIVAVNAPGEVQAEAWAQVLVRDQGLVALPQHAALIDAAALHAARREMTSVRRDVDELARTIAADVSAGRLVAIVDVAFANGADLALGERLLARVPIAQLGAYAAWNTAGNSLGSALAQGIVRSMTRREELSTEALTAHLTLLFLHLLDDFSFQGLVRTDILVQDFPALGLAPSFERIPVGALPEIEARLGRRLEPHVEVLARSLGLTTIPNGNGADRRVARVRIEPPRLPWQRVFELSITPDLELE